MRTKACEVAEPVSWTIAAGKLRATCIVVMFFLCAGSALVAQTLTTLAIFNGDNGYAPYGELVPGADGNLYGTTTFGGLGRCSTGPYGDGGCGTVYKVTPGGTMTTLHIFCLTSCTDGGNPWAGLVLASDGNFYGTAQNAGVDYCGLPNGCGVIFRITPTGTLTTLYNFSGPDGLSPHGGLVQGTDGSLYGTTLYGGTTWLNPDCDNYGCGTVFKITLSGTLTTLYNFCSQPNCADGGFPYASLVRATDGNFYGTTGNTFFKITPTGTLTTLHSFGSTDGYGPRPGPVQATDGNFYGTTFDGGNGYGTVFKITPIGTLTTLYSFCLQTNCADGSYPSARLLQATDGSLYGTTSSGGANNAGTVFKITLAGTLTTVYSFDPTVSSNPRTGLTQGFDGSFYGTTLGGGPPFTCYYTTCGTVYSLTGPSLTAVQFVPVAPCRLVDSRQTHTPIQGGTFQFFNVPQLGDCNIPATAAGYSLNVTVVPHRPLGYLTIWPAGRPQPYVSTMNSPDGRVKANAAIVPAGASAAVSVFATDTTDLILDINGYFAAPSSQTYQFYPLAPCRLVDTRNNHNDGTLQPGTERDYTIAGHCNIPTTATAYSFNVTVMPTSGKLDYLTVWPKGESRPNVSTLNDPTGTVVANAAIVPAGAHHATAFYASAQPTDLILDVNGYFAPAGTGGLSLYPVAPCRVLDTRNVGSGAPFQGTYNAPNGVDVLTSPCAPPSTAQAFVFNATVVPSVTLPYLTLWPHGTHRPNVSTLNAGDGGITSNMAIVPGANGSIDAYAAGLTQLILDISGYFAP